MTSQKQLWLQRQFWHLNSHMPACLPTTKFKPLTFPVPGYALFDILNIYNFTCTEFENPYTITIWCVPWNFANGAENLVLQMLQFH
jgi:hypothetical protein